MDIYLGVKKDFQSHNPRAINTVLFRDNTNKKITRKIQWQRMT
jgi:hypothetical protein